jgi:hypothetical protein
MSARVYLVVSGVFFGVVALLHLVRLVNQWGFQLGPWLLPLWVSWPGTLVPAALSLWAFRLAGTPPSSSRA